MKSISCLTSICLVTSALAITAACHPAAARSNSEQLSAERSNVLRQPSLLAGRAGLARPEPHEESISDDRPSAGRAGRRKTAPVRSTAPFGRGGAATSSHAPKYGWGRGGSPASPHSSGYGWGRGGSSASSHSSGYGWGRGGHDHPSEGRVSGGIFGRNNDTYRPSVGRAGIPRSHQPVKKKVLGIFEVNESQPPEHSPQQSHRVLGIFGR